MSQHIPNPLLSFQAIDWEAAGKQLVDEEQQAAAKAAAKKAKKLRQKLNKQHLQQEQPASEGSSLQQTPEPTDADGDVHHHALITTSLLTQSCQAAAAPLPPFDSHKSGSFSGQMPTPQPSPAAESLTTAFKQLGTTSAGSAVVQGLSSPASPGSTADQGMDQQVVTLDQRLSSGSDTIEDVDDDEFLQDLFKCPLTKVSRSCSNPTSCHTCLLL